MIVTLKYDRKLARILLYYFISKIRNRRYGFGYKNSAELP